MSVVDLNTRKPVEQDKPKGPALLILLQKLIGRIENGELQVEDFYLIMEHDGRAHSFDNGLTASEALTMLDRERFHILCALDGIKPA